MSKKYRGKTCVYCAIPASSADGDHVISREFFAPRERGDLPKVPACKDCNNAKSKLEHYLTAVLPFGSQHPDACNKLATMVPGRLAKNNKLFHEIKAGMKNLYISRNGSPWEAAMTLPLNSERLLKLFEYIAKGLSYHHWQVLLPPESYIVKAGFFSTQGQEIFERLLAHKAKERVSKNLGDGVFVYEGVQSAESAELTVWRMSLYGVEVSEGGKASAGRCSHAYAITAPERMPAARKLVRLLGMENTIDFRTTELPVLRKSN